MQVNINGKNSSLSSVVVPVGTASPNIKNDLWIGDPPPNQRPYIGDGDYPYTQPYIPPAQPPVFEPLYIPQTIPDLSEISKWISVSTTTSTHVAKWRIAFLNNDVKLSIDVPGVRLADASLEIENGTVRFTGKRFDTGAVSTETYFIGHDYDPETADAVIDSGVLTVMVSRFKNKRVHKVTLKDA